MSVSASKVEKIISSDFNLSLDKKDEVEKEILLKDMPDIEKYLPAGTNLNSSINSKVVYGDDVYKKATALHFSCLKCIPELAELLLNHGANPNEIPTIIQNGIETPQDNYPLFQLALGMMPLHIIKLFLKCGADYKMRNKFGQSLIDAGASCGFGDFSSNEPCFPIDNYKYLLAFIYKDYVFLRLYLNGNAVIENQKNPYPFPSGIANIIVNFCEDPSELSKNISKVEPYRINAFFGMMKRAYEECIRQEKIEKLCKLSDETLDKLIALSSEGEKQKSKESGLTFQYNSLNNSKLDKEDNSLSLRGITLASKISI